MGNAVNRGEVRELISKVGDGLSERKDDLIKGDLAAGSTINSALGNHAAHVHMMKDVSGSEKYIGDREGICAKDESVALVLPFNVTLGCCGVIAAQMLLGNTLRVRSSVIAEKSYKILESIWTKHFPGKVIFDFGPGKKFMTDMIQDPKVKLVGAYGVDTMAMQYKDMIQQYGQTYFFEGPGKNPAIVLDDADPVAVARQLFDLRFMRNSGQMCISPGRFYIHESIFERFTSTLVELIKEHVVVGDPLDPKTTIGPLGSESGVAMIAEQVADAVAKGAKVLHGGKIAGKIVPPTVVVNVNHQMKGMHEESFGPICWLMPYKTTDEVIKLAKDSKYGLAATVWGGKDAEKVKNALKGGDLIHKVDDFIFGEFGMVEINPNINDPGFAERMEYGPMGGYGLSGWVWRTEGGKFNLYQGPKSFALEASVKV